MIVTQHICNVASNVFSVPQSDRITVGQPKPKSQVFHLRFNSTQDFLVFKRSLERGQLLVEGFCCCE